MARDGSDTTHTERSEIARVLGRLEGEHTAAAHERQRVWTFAGIMIGATLILTGSAAAARFLELSDDPVVWQILGVTAGVSLLVAAAAVANARFTSNLKFVFAATSVACLGGDDDVRWQVARGDIHALRVRHIDERRLVLYVVTTAGKQRVVRGFDSVRRALGQD